MRKVLIIKTINQFYSCLPVGTVMNVQTGDWVRRDSGVGAGIDSYYEYLLKSYVLLGDGRYLDRFTRHYTAVMKYISHPPLLMDVQVSELPYFF